MEVTFTKIYENCIWGNNNNSEYSGSSGEGSLIINNKDTYIPFLKKFIIDNNIKKIVDLGCGDFVCGPLIYDNLDILYTGYDIYEKVINHNSRTNTSSKYTFLHLDFCNNKEDIISGDMCILKDVLMHWSLKNINNFLEYLIKEKKFKYILICNCCNQTQDNVDIEDGNWRQLSCDFLPLRKYNAKKIYNFKSNVMKEVSVIKINTHV
jgi:hypothetical protein